MERFFGGSPLLVILKLVTASLIIGVVLSFFGFNPNNLYHAIIRLGDWISSLGFDAVKDRGPLFHSRRSYCHSALAPGALLQLPRVRPPPDRPIRASGAAEIQEVKGQKF